MSSQPRHAARNQVWPALAAGRAPLPLGMAPAAERRSVRRPTRTLCVIAGRIALLTAALVANGACIPVLNKRADLVGAFHHYRHQGVVLVWADETVLKSVPLIGCVCGSCGSVVSDKTRLTASWYLPPDRLPVYTRELFPEEFCDFDPFLVDMYEEQVWFVEVPLNLSGSLHCPRNSGWGGFRKSRAWRGTSEGLARGGGYISSGRMGNTPAIEWIMFRFEYVESEPLEMRLFSWREEAGSWSPSFMVNTETREIAWCSAPE